MFSVFNTNLQTDMGKTIVRRHLATTDAQAVWKELSEHMKTSSKGASEKRRLTQYVTNTVLDDNFKGTTEQFVLHFNEQFSQLEEISEDDERLPPSVKLTLLQTAVRSINDPPQIKIPNSHIVRYTCQFEQYLSHRQNESRAHPSWAPTKEPTVSCWRHTPTPKQDRFQDLLEAICPDFLHTNLSK